MLKQLQNYGKSKVQNKAVSLFKGILLGIALIIPGISAGTMALITGLYSPLISFLSKIPGIFSKKQFLKFCKNFFQLLPVFIGVFLGLALSIHWAASLIAKFPILSYSFFSGIILASIPLLLKKTKINFRNMWILYLSALGSFILSYFDPIFVSSQLWIFLSVYLAVLAMLLPGASGSYILILMGTYSEVLALLKNFSEKSLIILGAALLSLLSCSKWIQYLLNKHKNHTMISLTGLTLGGGMGIFPLKSAVQFQQSALGSFSLLFAGAFLVLSLHLLRKFFQKTKN